ncbi:MAG TPA: hypothetical protein VLJ15_05935 [Gammaproteobacteria bacterium]|nr:hypothetical protein [Gammaproteobacteria bacterium]
MAFTCYIQTENDIKTLDRDQLERQLWRILDAWEPVANFPGDKRGMKIVFVDDQPHHSIKITIPFLGVPLAETTNIETYILQTLGVKLRRMDCGLTSSFFSEDDYSVHDHENPDACYDYNLDYLPRRPLHPVVKEANALLQEIKRIKKQIGSHTNHTVMQMIESDLKKLIERYDLLKQDPLKNKLKNFTEIKEAFVDTITKYKEQKKRLVKKPWLNDTATNHLSGDPLVHVFSFLTLKEMQTVLFLISHDWTSHASLAITSCLLSKISPANSGHVEFKQPNISLVGNLCSDLRRDALKNSKLHLDVAQALTTFGFERFHYYTKADILKHPNEVNNLIARDPRYCFFFAKFVTCILNPEGSAVKWAYEARENIARLWEREPGLHMIVLSMQLAEVSMQLIVNHADTLLKDLDTMGLSLGNFLRNSQLCKLFLQGLVDIQVPGVGVIPADPEPWRNYVERHTLPEKTTSPAP